MPGRSLGLIRGPTSPARGPGSHEPPPQTAPRGTFTARPSPCLRGSCRECEDFGAGPRSSAAASGPPCAGRGLCRRGPRSLPGAHRRARACELPHPGLQSRLEGPAAGGARWGDGHAVVVSEGRRAAWGWRGAGEQGRGHTGGGRAPSGCDPSRPCLEQAPIRTGRLSSN